MNILRTEYNSPTKEKNSSPEPNMTQYHFVAEGIFNGLLESHVLIY